MEKVHFKTYFPFPILLTTTRITKNNPIKTPTKAKTVPSPVAKTAPISAVKSVIKPVVEATLMVLKF